MKILLTGRNGQLGSEIYKSLYMHGQVYGFNSSELNLREPKKIVEIIQDIKPDIIINTAAYTAVDKAEVEALVANEINHIAPSVMAQEAEKINSILIHFSTDYVFDGYKSSAYTEFDQTNPLNVYGRTKLSGEISVSSMCSRHLILRTSWVHGIHGHNFIKTILQQANEKESMSIIADQYGIPTSAAFLAGVTSDLATRAYTMQESLRYGIYHLTALGSTSWYEYGCFIVQECLNRGQSLSLSVENIKPIKTTEYLAPAKRPLNSCLDTRKFRDTFNMRIPEWQEGVRHTLNQILIP